MNRISTNPYIGLAPNFKRFTLNFGGRIVVASRPLVMGILNVTPDSFYAGSRAADITEIRTKARRLIDSGADIIDVGGHSTRPGCESVDESVEIERVLSAVETIRNFDTEIIISVDTFRASVAEAAVKNGADMINDISGGRIDEEMFSTISRLKAPYVLTHSEGDLDQMMTPPDYDSEGGVTACVTKQLAFAASKARAEGVEDIIVDPGFGFSKSIKQNFELLRDLPLIKEVLETPILVGLSRKSMLYKPLAIDETEALCATVAVDTIALMAGASIVRVHDPLPARQTIELLSKTYNSF